MPDPSTIAACERVIRGYDSDGPTESYRAAKQALRDLWAARPEAIAPLLAKYLRAGGPDSPRTLVLAACHSPDRLPPDAVAELLRGLRDPALDLAYRQSCAFLVGKMAAALPAGQVEGLLTSEGPRLGVSLCNSVLVHLPAYPPDTARRLLAACLGLADRDEETRKTLLDALVGNEADTAPATVAAVEAVLQGDLAAHQEVVLRLTLVAAGQVPLAAARPQLEGLAEQSRVAGWYVNEFLRLYSSTVSPS